MFFSKLRTAVRKVEESGWFIPAQLAFSALCMCAGVNLAGAVALIAAAVFLLILSDDTLSAICPVMFAVMVLTSYYDDYLALARYWWAVIPFSAALVIHFAVNRAPFVKGRFTWSLAAVSVALLIGGIGTISKEEYFAGVALYYVLGLGIGLLAVYVLICPHLAVGRGYDRAGRFAALVYSMALLAALLIILFYIKHWQRISQNFRTPFISYRNFCTTVMLFGLPMPCYFVKKNRLHLLSSAFIYLIMLVSGSRSALLFGTAEVLMCAAYVYVYDKERRSFYCRTALVAALPVVCAAAAVIYFVFIGDSGRMNEHFVRPTEARVSFYPQGIKDFLARPVLGYGIGNMKNADIYQGVPGSIIFYHNAVLQVLASLGLVGGAAYLYQLVSRFALLWKKRMTPAALMAIPFVGVLLMSQTNPGIFCPLPTALLLVIMFAVVEFSGADENGG